ncbi:hypothetical protein PBRA_007046 [Plasmodiophora brassicae]|uniref:Uncharacterized protein n=1 Tax=Plasmodiophora brassicae TaxID=37360 RepID=A0A0G4IUL7_PLABS|nr:hypothetical protein PBRA_007046 [Plasmodiophora brassicae]
MRLQPGTRNSGCNIDVARTAIVEHRWWVQLPPSAQTAKLRIAGFIIVPVSRGFGVFSRLPKQACSNQRDSRSSDSTMVGSCLCRDTIDQGLTVNMGPPATMHVLRFTIGRFASSCSTCLGGGGSASNSRPAGGCLGMLKHSTCVQPRQRQPRYSRWSPYRTKSFPKIDLNGVSTADQHRATVPHGGSCTSLHTRHRQCAFDNAATAVTQGTTLGSKAVRFSRANEHDQERYRLYSHCDVVSVPAVLRTAKLMHVCDLPPDSRIPASLVMPECSMGAFSVDMLRNTCKPVILVFRRERPDIFPDAV